MCLRGAGTTNYLVRAVKINGIEWGMTEFAELIAETLEQDLGPRCDFHEVARPWATRRSRASCAWTWREPRFF